MAKEEKEKKPKGEHEGGKKSAPKKHLHHIRLEVTRDHAGKATGVIEHHAYKAKPTDHHTEPERPVAVHGSPEEAGESAQENLAQAMGGGGGGEGQEEAGEGEGGEGAAPAAGM